MTMHVEMFSGPLEKQACSPRGEVWARESDASPVYGTESWETGG